MAYRIGSGVDFHRLEKGREFWLGGIKIEHHSGATGHSDADVLLHAICDALLGALGLGDIGYHFPNTDPAYKDIDSKILLQHCYSLVFKEGYSIVNVDSTICLEEPKIKGYVPGMKVAIAPILKISEKDISIKATTTETMGFAGRGEGLFAYSTILLKKNI